MLRGEDLPRWERTIFAARNPSACARFFHKMISQFISSVLRFGKPDRGLFGKCNAYYGTVEAQGRGTLHCHMLIWLEGHPSPQALRDKMVSSDTYRDQMFRWLESVIKCELPGTRDVVEEDGQPIPRPKRAEESGNPHPGAVPAPSIQAFQKKAEFEAAFESFVTDLVKEFNWHEHKATCFKYVPGGVVPKDPAQRDALCRMRIDGSTCAQTHLDDETGSLLLRRLHPRIASYNDLVIFLMQCNMEIKFIGSGEAAKALLYYITDYITKPSLQMHEGLGALSYAIQRVNETFPGIVEDPMDAKSRGALTKVVNRMISRQELSHQQVMSYLVGGGDVYTSHTFRVLHWGSFDRLFRKFAGTPKVGSADGVALGDPDITMLDVSEDAEIPMEVDALGLDPDVGVAPNVVPVVEAVEEEFPIDAADDEDLPDSEMTVDGVPEESFVLTLEKNGSISATNQKQDYIYRALDPVFEGMSLYEFVGTTDKEKIPSRDNADASEAGAQGGAGWRRGRAPEPRGRFSSDVHTQYNTHRLRRRTVWTVPVILGERVPRQDREPEEKEAWARMMLILFVPWRRPEDLRDVGETWTNVFERQQDRISNTQMEIIHNMSVLSECRDARDTFREMRRVEALASLTDGLPAGGQQVASEFDESENQPFQLFDTSRSANAYEYVGDLRSSQRALDDKIGVQTRELVDRCFSTLR